MEDPLSQVPQTSLHPLPSLRSLSRADKIVLKKWYTIYKDHIRLEDYEIHDGMNLELYYQ